jgi:hypothetical protein
MSPFGEVQIQGHPKGPVFLGQKKGSGLDGTNLRHNPFSQYDLAGRLTQVDNAGSVDMRQVQKI